MPAGYSYVFYIVINVVTFLIVVVLQVHLHRRFGHLLHGPVKWSLLLAILMQLTAVVASFAILGVYGAEPNPNQLELMFIKYFMLDGEPIFFYNMLLLKKVQVFMNKQGEELDVVKRKVSELNKTAIFYPCFLVGLLLMRFLQYLSHNALGIQITIIFFEVVYVVTVLALDISTAWMGAELIGNIEQEHQIKLYKARVIGFVLCIY